MGQAGKTYQLDIQAEGKSLDAITTIPEAVPFDSMRFEPLDGLEGTYELIGWCTDPPGVTNYYRYFTKVDEENFFPGLASVVEDILFDGEEVEFPIARGQARTLEIDPETFGYFFEGETVTVKWTNIDEAHFLFWNTLEFNAANQGPFSSYTRIQSNINGGLGIWGGYNVQYKTQVVE